MKKTDTLLLMLFFTTIAFAQGAIENHKKTVSKFSTRVIR